MLHSLPDPQTLYQALITRDEAFEGRAFVCVKTTGIFCRLICPAPNPKAENTLFLETVAACLDAGFRPCKRCKPLETAAQAEPIVSDLVAALEADPGKRWTERHIIDLGYDPSTVRRAFKRHLGSTFLELARLSRLRVAAKTIAKGGRVIDAQLDAGFDSSSGFRAAFSRILSQPPAESYAKEQLRADWIETPMGPMIAVSDQQALHILEFFDRKELARELAKLCKTAQSSIGMGRFPAIDQVESELTDFFAGRPVDFSTPLSPHGSRFTKSVWAELRKIRPGQTCSYSDLARRIERPTAVRAVARANGANPIAIVVPCHRVIGADGSLTGYGGGLWRKRWLIEHEQKFSKP